jgi:precorrin-4/cobalt-precorrin-4 C11-methyltransferase
MKRLIGVGVGPGDPELVTVKAVRVLREADVVLVPVLAAREPGGGSQGGSLPGGQQGRAETIIRAYVAADRIRRLEFALNDTGGVTPRRAAAWHAAATAVAEAFAAGATAVAFGTLGDPGLYSTFSYLAQTVRTLVPEVTVETVAGITAMQDLASRAGLALAEGTEPVTLVPLNGGPGALDQALAQGGTVVGYKIGAAASPPPPEIRDRLQAAGRLDGAVIGARLGLDGELIAPAEHVLTADEPLPYLATLIVPALRAAAVGSGLSAQSSDTRAAAEACGTPTPAVIPSPNHRDVTLRSSERPRCDVAVVESSDESSPRSDSSQRTGRVVFVGAGPGAPDLITKRGAQAIATADIVIWASSLVDHRVVADRARPDAEIVDSAQLPMEQILPYYERAARDKLTVARVHSGDPSLWGAIQEQLERCHQLGLDTEVVPGVSSFTALAAAIQRELTIPEVSQSVILTRLGGGKTPMPQKEQVREFARHGTTMALFLSAARSGQLQEELREGGYPPDTPCVVAYQVTWPDELIVMTTVEDLAATIKERKLWKHTLILVGPGLAAGGSRSHLYHPGHFHAYRKADPEARKQLRNKQ